MEASLRNNKAEGRMFPLRCQLAVHYTFGFCESSYEWWGNVAGVRMFSMYYCPRSGLASKCHQSEVITHCDGLFLRGGLPVICCSEGEVKAGPPRVEGLGPRLLSRFLSLSQKSCSPAPRCPSFPSHPIQYRVHPVPPHRDTTNHTPHRPFSLHS